MVCFFSDFIFDPRIAECLVSKSNVSSCKDRITPLRHPCFTCHIHHSIIFHPILYLRPGIQCPSPTPPSELSKQTPPPRSLSHSPPPLRSTASTLRSPSSTPTWTSQLPPDPSRACPPALPSLPWRTTSSATSCKQPSSRRTTIESPGNHRVAGQPSSQRATVNARSVKMPWCGGLVVKNGDQMSLWTQVCLII